MVETKKLRKPIPPLRALVFGVVLVAALIVVLFPGESSDNIAGAVLMALVTGGIFTIYLYLFQPKEVSTLWRLLMVGALMALWVLLAKVFFSITLPDNAILNTSSTSVVLVNPAEDITVSSLISPRLAVACIKFIACLKSP